MDNMQIPCPVCSSTNISISFHVGRGSNQSSIITCKDCGDVSNYPEKKFCGGWIAITIPMKLK